LPLKIEASPELVFPSCGQGGSVVQNKVTRKLDGLGFGKGMSIKSVLIFLVGVLSALPVFSATPSALDQQKIHQLYTEGDFEKVLTAIHEFTQTHPTHSQDDSIFIAKYLAVIYAANPATREMGRSYMFRLLKLQPNAKIVDLFVSDEIDRTFEKTKEEFAVHQEVQKRDALRKAEQKKEAPERKAPAASEKKSTMRTWIWLTGGVTLAIVGGSLVYFLQPEKSKDKYYELPE
jgi:hypothetical protein